jgi:hypothetical protein
LLFVIAFGCGLLAIGSLPLALCQLPTHNQPLDFGYVSGEIKKDEACKG